MWKIIFLLPDAAAPACTHIEFQNSYLPAHMTISVLTLDPLI
jgi:hypothetical protein